MKTRSKAIAALCSLLLVDLIIYHQKYYPLSEYFAYAIAPICIGLILAIFRNRVDFLNNPKLNFIGFHVACCIIALPRYFHLYGTFDGYALGAFYVGGWIEYPLFLTLFRSEIRRAEGH